MEGHILVTTEELTNTSEAFGEQGNRVRNLTAEMTNIVTNLSNIWEGEASQAYLAKFRGLDDDIQKMHNMISEHVRELVEMAQLYSNVEQQNETEISNLASDVII